MKLLIGANFKMNLSSKETLHSYFETLKKIKSHPSIDVFFAPQMSRLDYVSQQIMNTGFLIGSQNFYQEEAGAYTGETSVQSLCDIGVTHAIIGHGERKKYFSETNTLINQKIQLALKHHIRPILCIGESLEQKQSGETMHIIETQIQECLDTIDRSQVDIAYEPLRAIGTGLIPEYHEIDYVHSSIRSLLKNNHSRILYGGSSNEKNDSTLLEIPEVNGFLVGGASLNPEAFAMMIEVCEKKNNL